MIGQSACLQEHPFILILSRSDKGNHTYNSTTNLYVLFWIVGSWKTSGHFIIQEKEQCNSFVQIPDISIC